jgi:hypothetical protein
MAIRANLGCHLCGEIARSATDVDHALTCPQPDRLSNKPTLLHHIRGRINGFDLLGGALVKFEHDKTIRQVAAERPAGRSATCFRSGPRESAHVVNLEASR